MSHHSGAKAILAALIANVGIAVTKFIAFLLTGSSSMLAEAVHSLADSSNQVLLLIGSRSGRRVADEEHPFGYGRDRYFYSFIVAMVLFSLGGLFALYEAWHKFSDPHGIDSWRAVPVVVLLAAIVMESFSLRTAVHESRPFLAPGQSWWTFIRTSKQPELPVVLLEDTAALIGLVVALFGVSMTLVTGDGRWDAAGSAAIGVLLVVVAVILGREMKSALLGESASPQDVAAIRGALAAGPACSIIHLRTLHLGPDDLLVAAKVDFGAELDMPLIAAAIDELEAAIRAVVPHATSIFIEPDLRRS